MKRKSLWILLLIIAVTAVSFYLKRTLSGDKPSKLDSKVDEIFSKWDKPDSPGASLAVVKGKKVIYQRGYGLANLEYDIPITPQTVFHVASVSKQFTAFANIRAADVFPNPLGPENKNACGSFPEASIIFNCSLTSAKSSSLMVCGRYFK